jgi:hypothetical protein
LFVQKVLNNLIDLGHMECSEHVRLFCHEMVKPQGELFENYI